MKLIKFTFYRLFCCCCLVLLLSATVGAQDSKTLVTGIVKNESGLPLANVSVIIRNSRNNFRAGTTTDVSGVFSFSRLPPGPGYGFVISYIGYETQDLNGYTLKPDATFSLVAKLSESRNTLQDIVIIGYGNARRREVSGSVDVVSAKSAGSTASTNPSQLLIGKSAGVQVIQNNGTPGADAQIIIRGTGSFTSVDPLYVIDGIQGDKNYFNALSPQDIENITILKDASSTAIYGSAAANGVVIVTTRKGRNGAPHVSILSQWGQAKAWKQLHLLNAAQYVNLLKDFLATSNTAIQPKFNTPAVLVDSNNWQSQIFRSALVTENDINISGGSDKVTYSFSTGFTTQKSIVKDLGYKKLNLRSSLDENLGRLKLGQSITLRYTQTTGQLASLVNAIGYAPYKPILDPTIPGGYSILSNRDDNSDVGNPLQPMGVQNSTSSEFVLFPQAYGDVNIGWGLHFHSQFAAEIGGGKYTSYQYPYEASNFLTYGRQAGLNYNDYNHYILENYLSFNKTMDKHGFAITLGNSYSHGGTYSNLNALGTNIANDNLQNISVSPAQAVTGSDHNTGVTVISYFGRLIYTFDNKYSLSVSDRVDGASNFGSANRFGYFPGAGLAWDFMEEDFMKSFSRVVTAGKLRFGYGRTGNNNIGNFLTTPYTFSGSPNGNIVYSLGPSEGFANGVTINQLANPFLKWETTDQYDAGLEVNFKNKLNLTLDFYDRKSTGLLVSVPLPASLGTGNTGQQPTKTENAADAENKGIELSLGYSKAITSDLNINVSANVAYNHNNVLSLGNQSASPIKAGSFNQLNTFTYTNTGSAIGSFYGYELDHVARDQAEIDALNAKAAQATGNPSAVYQVGLKPGDFIFKDLNRNGTVTDSDQAILGNPIPKFVYGFNASLSYKNFDLNLVFSGVGGLKLVNALKYTTEIESTGHNATTAILNRWRNPGDNASLPRAGSPENTGDGNLRTSDWWLENGDYFRLRNVTIGYTIPQKILNLAGPNVVDRIRFYIAAQNLFTITKYSGYDPEVSTQSSNGDYIHNRGIDDGQLPQPRTLMLGLQIGF